MQFYRRWLEILVVLAAALLASVSPAAAQDESLPPAYDYKGYLFEAINNLRTEHGLLPLTYNVHLERAAMVQAEWMIANSSYAHHHNGSHPSSRAVEAGYTDYDWCCGENTFLSPNPSPEASFAFWTASSSHYYQMLSDWHTEIGIGYFVGETYTAQVMVFGQQWRNSTAVLGRTNATTLAQTTTTQPVTQVVNNVTSTDGCAAQHVVQPGENLFRISLNNGVSMDAVAAANGITNYTMLVVGQSLCIPAGGSGAVNYVSNTGAAPSNDTQNIAAGDPVGNWCYPGGPWGDGRCDDPDPDVSQHLWECGYYFAQGYHKEGC
jgi:LysM repeat protein